MLVVLTRLEPGRPNPRPGFLALGPAERQRAQRLRGLRRDQYVAGRALLRELCARLAGGAPARWRFNAQGQPLASAPGRRAPWVSLAHSGPWLAAAASWRPGVGVDLERHAQDRDWTGLHRLLKRWDLPPARPAWPATPSEAAFLGDWTRFEAAYKAWHSAHAAGQAPGRAQAWTWHGKDLTLSLCAADPDAPQWACVGGAALRQWRRCPRPWDVELARIRP